MSGVTGYFLRLSLARVQYVIPDRHRLCVEELRQASDLLGVFPTGVIIVGFSETMVPAYEIHSVTSQKNIDNRNSLSRGYVFHYIHISLSSITLRNYLPNQSINQSIHWHVQNAVIPCRSQEPLPFLPVLHFFLPLLSADHSSILPHFIQPSICWSTSWSCCFQIHIQYSFGNPIFFHSLYMSKPT